MVLGQGTHGLVNVLTTILQMRILRPRDVKGVDKVTQLISGRM